jgi:hypothetical protein
MTINYDGKGKIFTDIVPKEPITVRVQTTKHYLTGEVHVRVGYRLKDELDLAEPFLAITNAVVYDTGDKVLFQTKFMAIRRDQVVWITADDEMKKENDYVK